MFHSIISILFLTVSTLAFADTETKCTFNNQERSIKVEGTLPCKVKYQKSKDGEYSEVASAQNQQDYCQKVSDRIKTNLENASWTCNAVGGETASATTSEPAKKEAKAEAPTETKEATSEPSKN